MKTEKQIISTKKAPAAIGPYAQAIKYNGLVYTSGQIAIEPTSGELIQTNISEETRQVMKNMKAVLNEANSNFSSVVKTTIFLKDMNDFSHVNEVYASFFDPNNVPARETVEVSQLPKHANVEISMIAIVSEK